MARNWATSAPSVEHSCLHVGSYQEIHFAPLSSPTGPPRSCQHTQCHLAHTALSFPLTWLKYTVNKLIVRALLLILPSKLHQTKLQPQFKNYCQSMASLNYHFQLATLSLHQSPCCLICCMSIDWFLNMNWSFSSALGWRHQMKLAGGRFKTNKMKSFRASCSKMWQIWEVHMVSWRDCNFMADKRSETWNKSVEDLFLVQEVLCH